MEMDTTSEERTIETISRGFNRQLDLKCDGDDSASKFLLDAEVRAEDCENEEENEDADDDDDDDFTFMFVGGYDSPVDGGDKVLEEDGEIRPVFPLFDQNLLLDGEYEVERLPIQPPVDNIFIQSPENDATTGPYCVWSKESAPVTAELSKKSNSTGFSKLWRLKEKGGRSNSYGRDAFVFFKGSSDKKTTVSSSSSPATSDGTFVKVNVAGGGKARVVKQGTNKSTVSAYLKSRGEEERRRSYLPYRPELMTGFFTNVHGGGLTKNVHPY